jgi:hypothetical protein
MLLRMATCDIMCVGLAACVAWLCMASYWCMMAGMLWYGHYE